MKFARILASLAFVLLSASAFAQGNCQQHYGGGQSGWSNCGSYSPSQNFVVGGNNQVATNGVGYINPLGTAFQQIVIPQGVVAGQPFLTNYGGVQQRCTLVDRALSAGAQGLLAGGIGYIAERLFNRDNHNLSATLATGGMFAGATITCDPNIHDDGDTVRQQVVRTTVQPAPQPGNQVVQPQSGVTIQGAAVTRYSCNPRVNGEAFALQVGQNTFCPELESAMLLAARTGQPVQAISGGVQIAGQNFEMVSGVAMVQNIINLMARSSQTKAAQLPSVNQPQSGGNASIPPYGCMLLANGAEVARMSYQDIYTSTDPAIVGLRNASPNWLTSKQGQDQLCAGWRSLAASRKVG